MLATAGSGTTLLVTVVGVLLAPAARFLLATISFALVSIHGLLIFELYLERGGQPQPFRSPGTPGIIARADAHALRLIGSKVGIAFAVLIVIGYMAFGFARRLRGDDQIVVVARRGASRVTPENSMSQFRKAIEAGADMIELDVQETADGVIVVTHDRDLMRIAGDPRIRSPPFRLTNFEPDIGRRLGAEFAGERLATLADRGYRTA